MKKREHFIYTIKTENGKYIKASADHPIYTKNGMKCTSDLQEGEEIITYPFNGVRYEEPSDEIVATIDDVEKYLDGVGITNKGNAKRQIINRLKELKLLPLRLNSPQLPVLIKIMGFIFGDGVLTFLKNKQGFIHFYAEEEDLELIKRDLAKIGVITQKVFKRKRHHKIKTQYSLVEFDFEEKNLIKKSTGFAALLAVLGVPVGRKTHKKYLIPKWLKKAKLWQKRLFLSAFFGAELMTPRTLNKYNFNSPQLNMNKSESLLKNGIEFLEDVRHMLSEFEVKANEPVFVKGNDYLGVNGQTRGLRLVIKGNQENLIRLYERIGYEYNIKKQKLACLAIDYIKLKKKTVETKNVDCATNNGLLLKRRVGGSFISFDEFVKTKSFGHHGLVLDKIEEIKNEKYDGYVYDFTINHNDHNFIANNFVISNCGMKLLTTNLTEKEVQPKLRLLVDTLFKTVPAGVGSKGFVKINKQQFNNVVEEGVKWCVDNGYGWKEDIERTESNGCIDWADVSKISDKAVSRGMNQLGTLGSGNHYLEIQHVKKENIFDEKLAKKFGIFPDQVVVMFHCGSRGFGHQCATDYLKVFLEVMPKYGIKVLDRELACAPFNSKEGQDYYKAMACAANMAFANRQVILHRVREAFEKVFGKKSEDMEMDLIYDVAHNIAKVEEHKVDGKKKKLVVHRKGATRCFGPGNRELASVYQETGQPVIVGGSMETGSFLCVGTKEAEEETFASTMHGSGRTMSRTKAKHQVRGEQLQKDMEKRGIYVHAVSMSGLAEEAGFAYKEINEVVDTMEKAGVSKKVALFSPIGNVKG